jgi:hypothetical protein
VTLEGFLDIKWRDCY